MAPTASPLLRPSRYQARGFTLAELMAVVVIVGILATIAAVGYRKYVNAAKASEGPNMINGIKAAQEAYRAETLTYLDVSGTLNTYYPSAAPLPAQKQQWGGGTTAVASNWRRLNVAVAGPVYFVYAAIAGNPGAVRTDGIEIANPPTFGNAVEPWYLIQAKADLDGDGAGNPYTICMGSSFTTDIYCEGDGK